MKAKEQVTWNDNLIANAVVSNNKW